MGLGGAERQEINAAIAEQVASNPPIGTATLPVQGVVTDWGGGFYNVKSPSNTGANGAAKGDGATDDTLAIQAAINAAQSVTNPGLVWLPAGTFLISAAMNHTGTVYMMGPGTIKQKNASNLSQMFQAFDTNENGSIWAYFTVDGNQANQTSGGNGFDIEGPLDCLIYGVTVKNMLGQSFFLGVGGTTTFAGGRVDSCVVTNGRGKAFATAGHGNNWRFHKCTVRNQTGPFVGQGQAFSLGGGTDCMITECTLGPGLVSQAIIVAAGSDRTIIANNRITAYDDAIQIIANHCQVLGNNITLDSTNSGGGVGIVTLAAASYALIAFNEVVGLAHIPFDVDLTHNGSATSIQRGHLFVGNIAKGCTAAGDAGFAISGSLNKARRITFACNQSLDNAGYGFSVGTGDIDGVYINDNQAFGNAAGPLQDAGTATNVVIRNNPGINPVGNLSAPGIPATGTVFANPKRYDCTVYVAGGTLTAIGLGGVPPPVNSTFSTATTGGTLADATTYYYRVTALNANGETLASTETSITTGSGGGTNTVTVKWGFVNGATGYNVYGRTTGAEQKIATNVQDNTFVDTGSVTPSGALPGSDTTGNTATGITAAAPAGAVHTLRIPALGAVKLTYTGAPSWTWFGD